MARSGTHSGSRKLPIMWTVQYTAKSVLGFATVRRCGVPNASCCGSDPLLSIVVQRKQKKDGSDLRAAWTDQPYSPTSGATPERAMLKEVIPFQARVHLPWERLPGKTPLCAMGVIPPLTSEQARLPFDQNTVSVELPVPFALSRMISAWWCFPTGTLSTIHSEMRPGRTSPISSTRGGDLRYNIHSSFFMS